MLPEFELCCDLFEGYGKKLIDEQYQKFNTYAEFLVEYNNKVNLTAITDPEQILIKHFLDSCLLLKHLEIAENSAIIDVGTGAGFPSVPLKIIRPDLKITLLDSLDKRITFLEQLCDKLEIEAEFIHGRAEDIGKKPEYREKFDVASARAVANMSVLSELCLPFVRVGGYFAAIKGPGEDVLSSSSAVEKLGGGEIFVVDYTLEGDGRRIAAVKKISQTSTRYPRNWSQIKKKPL